MSLHNGVEPGDVSLKRFGLKYDPPSIVLEYLQMSTGKLFHRRIAIRKLRPDSDPARTAIKLRCRNEALLGEDKVSFDQLVTLVKKLQEATPSLPIGTGGGSSAGHTAASLGGAAGAAAAPADHASPSGGSGSTPSSPAGGACESPAGLGRPGGIPDSDIDYHTVDLNKMSTEELQEHKARMDGAFLQNQKKPGDAGFVYDVRVDFGEVDANEDPSGWDDSEEEEIEC